MSGPSRELPPLVVRIDGDNSGALKSFKGTIEAAKATAKTLVGVVKEYVAGSKAAFERDFTNYRLLQKAKEKETRENYRRMKQLDKAASKIVIAENKKSQAAIRDEQQKTVKFFRTNAKSLNRDSEQNYGRLTPTFKGTKGVKAAKGGVDLNALVGNAEKTAKAVASKDAKVMAKADRDRAQSVMGARNAQRAQTAQTNKEAAAGVAEKLRRDKQLDKSAKQSRTEEDQASRKRMRLWGREKAQEIKNDNESIARSRRGYVSRLRDSTQEALQNAKHDEAAIRDTKKKEDAKRSGYVSRLRDSTQEALQNSKNDLADIKSTQAAAEKKSKTLQGIQDFFKSARNEQLKAGVDDALQNAKHDSAAIASTNRTTESRARAVQGIRDHFARANRERLQQMGRELTQQARNDAADIRYRQSQERRDARAARAANRGGGMGGGMGGRADLYMHSAAVQNISGGIRSIVEPWAQLESHITTIKVFTGSMEKARDVAAQQQQFALVSPYSLNSVMEATGLLMKFGQSSVDAVATVQMLGDVAGGSSERLKHVALGIAQAVSLGRLQGQELRQMTEGGFNPLRIAAEQASGVGVKSSYTDEEEKLIQHKIAEFDHLMRSRKLDAKFAVAALKMTTSKGGRHFEAVKEASLTPIGLATQIMESVELVAIETVKLFDKELKALLQTVLDTVTAFIKWMRANKALVAQIAILSAKIIGAFLVFHLLSWAIAGARWVLGGLWEAMHVGYNAIAGLIGFVVWLAGAFTAEGAAATSAWLATFGPVALITIAVVAAIAAVTALGFAIAVLGNDNGIQGVFDNIYNFGMFLVGFFYNFGHNLPLTFEFVAANWQVMAWDMMETIDKAVVAMGKILYDLFVVQLPQMIEAGSAMAGEALLGLVGMGSKKASTGESGTALFGNDSMVTKIRESLYGGKPKGGYDTSMLKLDTPDPTAFLKPYMGGSALNEAAVPEWLKKYMKEDGSYDINFEDFVKSEADAGPGGKGKGKKGAVATRDHALVGSNEQAQRTYDYTQAMMGSTGAVTKDNAPLKQVALLEQIARNTQPDNDRGDSIGDMDID